MFLDPYIATIQDWDKYKTYQNLPKKIFLMTGSMLQLPEQVYVLKKNDHEVFLHCDFIQGLNPNTKEAIDYIYEVIGPDGIISTKGSTIRNANKVGLKTIQRIFVLDTLSLTKSIESCQSNKPDAVEIMPGLMPTIISKLVKELPFPIIAGGLIHSKEDAMAALAAGASAVSASNSKIWN